MGGTSVGVACVQVWGVACAQVWRVQVWGVAGVGDSMCWYLCS